MKIIQFCQLYPPAIYGGGEFLFFQYARELVRQGHEVIVITQRLRDTKRFEVIDGVRIYRIGRPLRYDGHLNMNVWSNIGFILKAFREGLRIAKGSDVIHSNAYAPVISAHLTSFFLKIPHVISLFDVYSNGDFWVKWSNQKGVFKPINFIGPLIEKIILRLRPSLIHTISEASKRDLLNAGVKAPIRVVPCVIDLRDYKVRRVKVKNQFCYVGRHVFYKNVDVIIKAMPQVLSSNPSVKFIVIGDGPMRKKWMALARRLGVSSSVVFTGRISDELKLKIIRESKFSVLPSTVEGFGIVILESWALNKPIIVSDLPPMNELVSNLNGALVNPKKINDWVKAINKMIKKQPTGLRKFAEKYNVKKVTKQLISLFKSVC